MLTRPQQKRARRGQDLYFIQMAMTGDIKIGRSGDVEARLRELQVGSPHKLRIIIHLPNQGHLERQMHQHLDRHRLRVGKGEWFREEGLPVLPIPIYEELDLESIDWWKRGNRWR